MNDCQPVRMVVRWRVPSAQACRVVNAAQALMMSTRREQGCLNCSLTTDAGEAVALSYSETWQTEPDLRRHLVSEQFAVFAGLLEAGVGPPVVEFALPRGLRGLDYALEIRETQGNVRQESSEIDGRQPRPGR